MVDLADVRCANHAEREAAARCPLCRRYFCRECVTEHDGRLVCASCLGDVARRGGAGRRRVAWLARCALAAAAFLVVWVSFYVVGRALVAVPTSYHEGALWQDKWWEEE